MAGILGYKREIEELNQQRQDNHDEYEKKVKTLSVQINQAINQYNVQINVINSEKHSMREELKRLYDFLNEFGDCGVKITPFDFIPENMISEESMGVVQRGDDAENVDGIAEKTVAGLGIAAGAAGASSLAGVGTVASTLGVVSTSVVAGPVLFAAAPIIGFIALGAHAGKSKKNYLEALETAENEKTQFDEDIADRKQKLKLYKELAEIANLYRALITIVRDTIKDTVIPELNGVRSFLYADAIKDNLLSGYTADNAEIKSITVFSNPGSPYYKHYVFIKNAFDYYSILHAFFTSQNLTKLTQSSNQSEFNRYKQNITQQSTEVKAMNNSVIQNAMFN